MALIVAYCCVSVLIVSAFTVGMILIGRGPDYYDD